MQICKGPSARCSEEPVARGVQVLCASAVRTVGRVGLRLLGLLLALSLTLLLTLLDGVARASGRVGTSNGSGSL